MAFNSPSLDRYASMAASGPEMAKANVSAPTVVPEAPSHELAAHTMQGLAEQPGVGVQGALEHAAAMPTTEAPVRDIARIGGGTIDASGRVTTFPEGTGPQGLGGAPSTENKPAPQALSGDVITPDGTVVAPDGRRTPAAGIPGPENGQAALPGPAEQAGNKPPETPKPEAAAEPPISDQEARIRQGEDFRVAHGEMTPAERDAARAQRATEVVKPEGAQATPEASKPAATPENATREAQDKQREDELKTKPYSEYTEDDKKFMADREKSASEQKSSLTPDQQKFYDENKDKTRDQLSEDERKKMDEIRNVMEGKSIENMTPEQLQQRKKEVIEQLVNGENIEENLKELSKVNEKQGGEGLVLTDDEKQKMVDKILNPESNDPTMKEVRENMIAMKRIELQLLAQGQTLKKLREERKVAVEAAKDAVRDADNMNLTNGDNLNGKMAARDKAYNAMMNAMQKRAQITFVKLGTGKLIAEHEDRNQYVMRKTGVTGGLGAVMNMVGAKMGLAGAEIGYQINSAIDGSVLDADESIHIPGIGLVTG